MRGLPHRLPRAFRALEGEPTRLPIWPLTVSATVGDSMLERRQQQVDSLLRLVWRPSRSSLSTLRPGYQRQHPLLLTPMVESSSRSTNKRRMVSQWAAKVDTQAHQEELAWQGWRINFPTWECRGSREG